MNKVVILADCGSIPLEAARKYQKTIVVAGAIVKLPRQKEIASA